MDAIEAAAASGDSINGLGSHFMLDLNTYAYGGELGFEGIDFYLAGRAGVLGEVPAAVVVASLVFFEPTLVEAAWTRSAKVMSRLDAAKEFAGVAHRWADANVPDDVDARRLASSRDLKVWAHLEMSESGVRVTELEGDPTFKAALPAKSLERMLNLEHYRYEVKGKRAPAKATMVLEGLYTKPYIWLARGLILGLIAMFAVMVAVVWHHRGKDDDDDEESPPRSESPSVDEEDDLVEEGAT